MEVFVIFFLLFMLLIVSIGFIYIILYNIFHPRDFIDGIRYFIDSIRRSNKMMAYFIVGLIGLFGLLGSADKPSLQDVLVLLSGLLQKKITLLIIMMVLATFIAMIFTIKWIGDVIINVMIRTSGRLRKTFFFVSI